MFKKLLLASIIAMDVLTACDDNKDAVVTIHTEYGDMKVILFDETPLHKKNFIFLVETGAYLINKKLKTRKLL